MNALNNKSICEYIWVGGKGEIRSKTKVIHHSTNQSVNIFPEWNYDASSTGQATSEGNTEGILIPVCCYNNPLRSNYNCNNYLVLCEVYNPNNTPHVTNTRSKAKKRFNAKPEEEPWFGLEQEYFIILNNTSILNVFDHYCGTAGNPIERSIAENHMAMCLDAGLNISGINAEVALNQWEFQVGPCEGITAGDQLIIARYLLERIAEKYDAVISYAPKPRFNANGSGCHTNFSTKKMRNENGIEEIYKAIHKLGEAHNEHVKIYGKGNELRLTGKHETSSYTRFSWGQGTRNTSVRIPNNVLIDKCGYFEDRRPSANMDPYLVTSKIFETCCLK